MNENKTQETHATIADLLFILIDSSFCNLWEKVEKDIELKDFLKMVDLYRKLSPTNTGQKELLALLDKIREKAAKNDPAPDETKPGNDQPVPNGNQS